MFKKRSDDQPSKKLSGMLDVLIDMAQDMLEKFGEFDPMGMVLTRDGKVTMLDSTFIQRDSPVKGLTSNQLLRMIEDGIRDIRSRSKLDCAIIFYDAALRSQDGSEEPRSALVGRLEERGKGAYQVILEYEINAGQFKKISQYYIPKEYHLIPD